ncbi:GAF domain-containing protein [Salipiger sp. PrR002]|uniref:helix-turn-helix domain-containing protein n=1 Tax=Salipiger sp. PrR002 TaxID=2706489 RepID=UPI0013BD3B8C|nr:GAF domain-containing protein [Salipiger sp. PrR002]NDV98933.1 sigma-54-dependent Fis family transcriptional regulator [Salipiger sp. PrR002]NDW55670.1 sigma-54-dependent Fis family transcriptional regulator [Salipiger sp. PrR004]
MTTASRHAARVVETATDPAAAARSRLAASWRRSLSHHGLDPAQKDGVQTITQQALAERIERSEVMLRVAMPKLDALHQMLGSSGCGVLLTDAEGVVLDLRAGDSDMGVFRAWGLTPGSDWSEASEGTNGIGTCIAEARRVVIHRDEHFHARNTAMSCMDAPIFGPEGELIGALDVSSARADQTEAFNRLIAAMVAQTARQIEADTFRAAFPEARIIVADAEDSEASVLLAVDRDDLVQGATRAARRSFGLASTGPLPARPASDLFGREDETSGFERAERAAMVRALARTQGNVSEAARMLGVGRATFYRRMKKLGLS